jgi:hypothetical protein
LIRLPLGKLAKPANRPHHQCVFNELKGGDPMSSGFGFRNVAPADCPFQEAAFLISA